MSDEAKAIVQAIRALKKAKDEEATDPLVDVELDNDDFMPLPTLEDDWELLDVPEEEADPLQATQDRLKRIVSKRGMR